MAQARVIVAGPDAHQVAAAIIGQDIDSDESTICWTLVTKYYAAPLRIHIAEDLTAIPKEAWEAAIITYCRDQADSLQTSQVWHRDKLQSSSVDVGILLDVAGSDACRDITNNTATEWCSQHQYEHLYWQMPANDELDLQSDDPSNYGLLRLHEALSTHMWSSMSMSKEARMQAPTVVSRGLLAQDEDDDSDGERIDSGDSDDEGDKQDQHSSDINPARGETDPAMAAILQGFESLRATREQEKAGELPDDPSDDFDLEGLTSQLKSVREQSQTLPDAKRRERAAQLAMALMGAMFSDDDDDDDDNE
eukprot:TRINITY_DN4306_c0_g1_i1.p1 TRINITY_DN4306_c0_g1~~TRINITY_DN4306_c0_g1_i1.p1  ORF type:complete len:307 (+),score=81.16 TRINITY_DN4306_c0_g1_i1:3-923(+)